MTAPTDEIAWSADDIAATVAVLGASAAQLRAVAASLAAVPEAVQPQLAEFESEEEPDTAAYEGTGTSTSSALSKALEALEALAKRAEDQAEALSETGAALDDVQATGIDDAQDIDTDLSDTGTKTVTC